jgi:caffeoyl-CoA O-methyltransferase
MLGSTDEVQFFQLLCKAINAKKVIEVGAYTGYTTLSLALALPNDGQVVCCDISDKYLARDIWAEADVDKKIKVEIAPAAETLQRMIDDGQEAQYDFAFIDADKVNYLKYYELCLKLVRKGGIIAIDNVIWSGCVVDKKYQDEDTVAIRKVNEFVKNDKRVDISMMKLGDGTTFALKL